MDVQGAEGDRAPLPMTAESDTSQKLTRLLEYQRALTAFTHVAAETHACQGLMQHLTALVSRLTHVRHVKVLRYRPERGDLLIEAGVGWKPGVVGHTAMSTDRQSPPGRALQTGASVVIDDLPNSSEYRYSSLLREHGIVSVVNVPVQVEGSTWGVLEIDHERPRHFDDVDVSFLTALAAVLGMALQRCQTERNMAAAAEEHRKAAARAATLMRELQHRTKNNFQLILAILSLKGRHADALTRERFGRAMDRIHAIAIAHDLLSLREGGSSVEFDRYLRALCANIDPQHEEIGIDVEASPMVMPLDRAVPVGLIVNELVTNSLKHAFDESGGTIRVQFTVDEEGGEGCLLVEDDGRGLGKGKALDPEDDGALGLSLVEAFAEQLHGRLAHEPVPMGTRTVLRFPLTV